MMDIYRRLGAIGPSDIERIERALRDESVDPEVRRLASFIMADPDRRAVHDAAWGAACVTARLRTAFLLEMTTLARSAATAEFSAGPHDVARLRECLPVDGIHLSPRRTR